MNNKTVLFLLDASKRFKLRDVGMITYLIMTNIIKNTTAGIKKNQLTDDTRTALPPASNIIYKYICRKVFKFIFLTFPKVGNKNGINSSTLFKS